uniref:Uncharacterized protein n=1 Tax=Anguilla anguilla TaxID=7936 RepID=A0A0E9USF1_ANGAN
MLSWSLDFQ